MIHQARPQEFLHLHSNFLQNSNLLFAASLSITSLDYIAVFVKVASSNYREDIHHLLLLKGLAPQLIAYSNPNGMPKAYMMEYLRDPDWITLFDYLEESGISSKSMSFI
jgi:hypothetical protein